MRKAILCFAHKDVNLLNTLIDQCLYNTNGETDFYIHLDKKSEELKPGVRQSPNVIFINQNVSVTWGDDTMMRALYNCWSEIYASGKEYDYFIICTGQDLLVKPDLDKFLEENKGKIWLDARESNQWRQRVVKAWWPTFVSRDLSKYPRWNWRRLFRGTYVQLLIRFGIYVPKRITYDLSDWTLYYSYNWSIMPYEVFKYCQEFVSANPSYRDLYLNSRLPEDGFLASLIMNSPFKDNVQWNGYRNNWTATQTYRTDFYVHPKIFDMSDVVDIDNSPCYFARKFDSNLDAEVIEYYRNKVIKD